MTQRTDVQQLDCPIEPHYTTNATTQEGVAARLIDHFMDEHLPDETPDDVINLVKGITSRFH